jgi:hypothetical protein
MKREKKKKTGRLLKRFGVSKTPAPMPLDCHCPYCFQGFKSNKVHFRAWDSAGSPKAVDKKKAAFWKTRDSEYLAMPEPLPLDPAVHEDIRKVDINPSNPYIFRSAEDQQGNRLNTFLCPNCHNELPKELVQEQSKIIAFMGSTQVGKTHYIVSLIRWLDEKLAATIVGSSVTKFKECKQTINDLIKALENCALAATDPNTLQKPMFVVLKICPGPDQPCIPLVISLYDIAGELQNAESNNAKTYLDNADGILYLFDMSKTKTFREALLLYKVHQIEADLQKNPSDEELKKRLERAKEDLCHVGTHQKDGQYVDDDTPEDFAERMNLAERESGRFVAVIGSKADEISHFIQEPDVADFLPNWRDDLNSNTAFWKSFRTMKYSQASLYSISDRMRRTLIKDINFINKVQALPNPQKGTFGFCGATKAQFFAVSATGCSERQMTEDEKVTAQKRGIDSDKIWASALNPWHIEDPLFWLLDKMGIYHVSDIT